MLLCQQRVDNYIPWRSHGPHSLPRHLMAAVCIICICLTSLDLTGPHWHLAVLTSQWSRWVCLAETLAANQGVISLLKVSLLSDYH